VSIACSTNAHSTIYLTNLVQGSKLIRKKCSFQARLFSPSNLLRIGKKFCFAERYFFNESLFKYFFSSHIFFWQKTLDFCERVSYRLRKTSLDWAHTTGGKVGRWYISTTALDRINKLVGIVKHLHSKRNWQFKVV